MKHLPAGSTLIEMIVTLAVLGVVAAMVTLAVPTMPHDAEAERHAHALIADAARRALRGRQPVTLQLTIDGHLATATFFPDGRAVADSALVLDRLTGGLFSAR